MNTITTQNNEVWAIFFPREEFSEPEGDQPKEDYEIFGDEVSGRRFILAKWNERAMRLEEDEPIKSLQELMFHFYRNGSHVLFYREDSDQYFRMEKKTVKGTHG